MTVYHPKYLTGYQRTYHYHDYFIYRTYYVKGKDKVVPLLNYTQCHEDVLGEWRYSSTYS